MAALPTVRRRPGGEGIAWNKVPVKPCTFDWGGNSANIHYIPWCIYREILKFSWKYKNCKIIAKDMCLQLDIPPLFLGFTWSLQVCWYFWSKCSSLAGEARTLPPLNVSFNLSHSIYLSLISPWCDTHREWWSHCLDTEEGNFPQNKKVGSSLAASSIGQFSPRRSRGDTLCTVSSG